MLRNKVVDLGNKGKANEQVKAESAKLVADYNDLKVEYKILEKELGTPHHKNNKAFVG